MNSKSKRKRAVAAAMRSVSTVLRNTPAVARASYVHPQIVAAFEAGELSPDLLKGRCREGLTRVETGLMRFLEQAARKPVTAGQNETLNEAAETPPQTGRLDERVLEAAE